MATSKPTAARARPTRNPKTRHGDFGARLAAMRAAASLTQSELAERLGVSRRQIAYYESGNARPPGALLGLLADLFKVSTDVLLGRAVAKVPASRLSSAALARLRQIETMGGVVLRRLEATLAKFVVEERSRRGPGRGKRSAHAGKR